MEVKGLIKEEVFKRIKENKVNTFNNHHTRSIEEIFLSNTFTYFNFINLFLFLLVCFTRSYHNGAFFLTIIFNDCICIVQELRAKKMMDKMSFFVMNKIDVLRDNLWKKIDVDKIVLDDVIKVQVGDQIPTDAKIIQGYLEVNESIITGESDTCVKKENDEILAGTIITSGEAIVQVIRVGKDNIAENIIKDAKKYKKAKSLLNDEINKLMKLISFLIIPIGLLLFFSQLNSGELTANEAILKTVSAVIGMIPEGLVVLISLALTISTIRLSKKQVLVQDLYSIEALAQVDILCIDKTGTITTGSMNVTIVEPINHTLEELNQIVGMYIHAFSSTNVTSIALKKYFKEVDVNIDSAIPFSSDKKYAMFEANSITYYIGAYSFLFDKENKQLEDIQYKHASIGERVLTVAKKDKSKELECVGFIFIKDELRKNIQEIISYFYENNVDIKLISGDQVETVSALAKNAGIRNTNKYINLSDTAIKLDDVIEDTTIFGRVLPTQKKEIIESLQRKGHVVAMIGDGVNDVPSLKQADVSISIEDASQAAKNIANIVLLNNDFEMMVEIVKEGRRVINNISRGATMFLVKTCFSLLISIYVILLQGTYPFLPIHLTLIGMFGVAVPTFLLQFESCFEKCDKKFIIHALSISIPSSLTILFLTILCNIFEEKFSVCDTECHTIVVFLTFLVYSYTLKKVYTPFNKYRFVVLIGNFICMIASMLLLPNLFQLSISIKGLLFIVIFGTCSPLIISLFQKIINKILKTFKIE